MSDYLDLDPDAVRNYYNRLDWMPKKGTYRVPGERSNWGALAASGFPLSNKSSPVAPPEQEKFFEGGEQPPTGYGKSLVNAFPADRRTIPESTFQFKEPPNPRLDELAQKINQQGVDPKDTTDSAYSQIHAVAPKPQYGPENERTIAPPDEGQKPLPFPKWTGPRGPNDMPAPTVYGQDGTPMSVPMEGPAPTHNQGWNGPVGQDGRPVMSVGGKSLVAKMSPEEAGRTAFGGGVEDWRRNSWRADAHSYQSSLDALEANRQETLSRIEDIRKVAPQFADRMKEVATLSTVRSRGGNVGPFQFAPGMSQAQGYDFADQIGAQFKKSQDLTALEEEAQRMKLVEAGKSPAQREQEKVAAEEAAREPGRAAERRWRQDQIDAKSDQDMAEASAKRYEGAENRVEDQQREDARFRIKQIADEAQINFAARTKDRERQETAQSVLDKEQRDNLQKGLEATATESARVRDKNAEARTADEIWQRRHAQEQDEAERKSQLEMARTLAGKEGTSSAGSSGASDASSSAGLGQAIDLQKKIIEQQQRDRELALSIPDYNESDKRDSDEYDREDEMLYGSPFEDDPQHTDENPFDVPAKDRKLYHWGLINAFRAKRGLGIDPRTPSVPMGMPKPALPVQKSRSTFSDATARAAMASYKGLIGQNDDDPTDDQLALADRLMKQLGIR